MKHSIEYQTLVKYKTKPGLTNNFPLTFEVPEGSYLQVLVGFRLTEEGKDYTVQRINAQETVVFKEDLKEGVTVTLRRVSSAGTVPHHFQYTGNVQGGAEFSAKSVDENFEYLNQIVLEIEEGSLNSQDDLASVGEDFEETQEIAREALRTSNTAMNTAASAEKSAEQAIETAEASISTSEEALRTSEEAKREAENAVTTSQGATQVANTAREIAERAEEVSQESVAISSRAQEDSSEALRVSSDASTQAGHAVDVAEGIDSKAQQALDTSKDALYTASEAKETADGVDSKAEYAIQTSEEAKAEAGTAKDIAEEALEATVGGVVEDSYGTASNRAYSQRYVNKELERVDTDLESKRDKDDWVFRFLESQFFQVFKYDQDGKPWGISVNALAHTKNSINSHYGDKTYALNLPHRRSGTLALDEDVEQVVADVTQLDKDVEQVVADVTQLDKDVEQVVADVTQVGEVELYKRDKYSPIFEKGGNRILRIKDGTWIRIKGKVFELSGTEINLPAGAQRGTDYIIVTNDQGVLKVMEDPFEAPAKILPEEHIIGGFFYSEIPENETVSSGEFATSGAGMHWTQEDVNKIRGINEFSLWDIRFRAGGIIASPDSHRYGQLSNHGMVFDRATNMWYAIYHVSTDVDKYGVSRSGTNLASGTVLPLVPSAFGGNGSRKYDNLNWWTANELVTSQGARLLWEYEFNSRAFGVTENKVAGDAGTAYPKTERIKGLTSRLGCEQATGTHWYWGLDSSYHPTGSGWSYKDVTGGRGQVDTYGDFGLVRTMFGNSRSSRAATVGSRTSAWFSSPWGSHWDCGAVASRDLLIL